VGALSLSVVSSVSIVICNKALMSALGFIFGMRSNLALLQFSSDVLSSSLPLLALACLLVSVDASAPAYEGVLVDM
jgi:solute carrier family 35 protein E3